MNGEKIVNRDPAWKKQKQTGYDVFAILSTPTEDTDLVIYKWDFGLEHPELGSPLKDCAAVL